MDTVCIHASMETGTKKQNTTRAKDLSLPDIVLKKLSVYPALEACAVSEVKQ